MRHFERGIQPNFNEYVVAQGLLPEVSLVEVRAYTHGLAEGLSHAVHIPTLERENVLKKNASASHLLNFLDYSIDVNVGDLFRVRRLEQCYFVFSIHHRSGIFASADIFGNVTGGSNFVSAL